MLGRDVEYVLNQDKSFEFISSDREIDITNYDDVYTYVKSKNIAWIINCAGYTAVDKAEEEKEQAFQINSEGVKNLTKIAKIKGAKLIHFSTDYVFDGNNPKPYKENDPANPINIYGKSKLSGEKQIRENYDKYFIIRISWLFGKNGKNFVNTMLRLFREKSIVKVVSDQKGSPTYTKCVAVLILNIIKNTSERYGVYHFTNEGITTWYDFAQYIYDTALQYQIAKSGVNIVPIYTSEFPTKARRPKNSTLSKDKIKSLLNINPISWNEAVVNYIKEYSKEIL